MESKVSELEVCGVENADWLLQSFVDIVNSASFSLPITITIGGTNISGDLIGGKEYFNSLGENFSKSFSTLKNAEDVGALIAKHADIYNDPDVKKSPQYLHLKNAVMFDPEGNFILNGAGALWRGRISQIDGFIFGKIERA